MQLPLVLELALAHHVHPAPPAEVLVDLALGARRLVVAHLAEGGWREQLKVVTPVGQLDAREALLHADRAVAASRGRRVGEGHGHAVFDEATVA